MRKYNVLVTSAAFILFALVLFIMIGEMIPTASNDEKGEAVTETAAEGGVATIEETVFEPIETEVEKTVAEKDTAENAPKMDNETPEAEEANGYTEDDLLYLAKIVENEAGSDYCTDEHQRYVASVVLNRVASPRFTGDTILEIALCGYGDGQPIQYMYSLDPNEGEAVFWQIVPSERAIENARYVLENGVLDESVVWQANFEQGDETVIKFTYEFANPPTTYICR